MRPKYREIESADQLENATGADRNRGDAVLELDDVEVDLFGSL